MTQPDPAPPADSDARRHWMSVLAKAPLADLERAWDALEAQPGFHQLRQPEVGMVMVRGRAGGGGERFNLGEMTVTRCSVQVDGGAAGHGYVAGRNSRHAELVAVFDALLQDPDRNDALTTTVVEPLAAAQAERRRTQAAKAAATKVDFFTMVRGESGGGPLEQ